MYEFDTYISSIIRELRVSKKQKIELAEEFIDHLEMLKREANQNGLSEDESIKSAMERFGESNHVYKKLHAAVSSFRNLPSILLGVLITLYILLFAFMPTYGIVIAFHDYSLRNTNVYYNNILKLPFFNHPFSLFYFMVLVGYFVPVVFNRTFKFLIVVLTSAILAMSFGVCLNIIFSKTIDIGLSLTLTVEGLFGGIIGYAMLIAINSLNKLPKLRNLRKAV